MQGCFWMSHTTETLAKAPKAICSQKSIYWKLLLNLSLFKTFFPLSQEWHSDQNGQHARSACSKQLETTMEKMETFVCLQINRTEEQRKWRDRTWTINNEQATLYKLTGTKFLALWHSSKIRQPSKFVPPHQSISCCRRLLRVLLNFPNKEKK